MQLKNLVTLALFGTTLAGPIRKRGLATVQEAFQQATRAINELGAAAHGLNGGEATFEVFMNAGEQASNQISAATQLLAPAPAAAAVAAQGTTTPVQTTGNNALKAALFPFANYAKDVNPGVTAAVTAANADAVNNGILAAVNTLERTVAASMTTVAKKASTLAETTGALQQAQDFLQTIEIRLDALVNGLPVTDEPTIQGLRTIATNMNNAFTTALGDLSAAAAQPAAAAAPDAVAPAAVAPASVSPATVSPASVSPAAVSPAAVAPAAAVSSAAAAPVIVAVAPDGAAATSPVALASPVASSVVAVQPAAASGSILNTS